MQKNIQSVVSVLHTVKIRDHTIVIYYIK